MAIQLIEAGANPKSFHKIDDRNDYATNGCYLRPIHYLVRISERRDDFLKDSLNFKGLIEVFERHGESLKEAEADLKGWKQWRYGAQLPPSADDPQGLIVPKRPDFKKAIEAEHQQWLKQTQNRNGQ